LKLYPPNWHLFSTETGNEQMVTSERAKYGQLTPLATTKIKEANFRKTEIFLKFTQMEQEKSKKIRF